MKLDYVLACMFLSRFLRSCGVEDIQAGTFARLKGLRELYLSGNRIKILYSNTFRGDRNGELNLDIL